MLEKIVFLTTSLLGFVTLLLIGFRFKTNRHTNLYFILFLLLSSFRFLAYGVIDLVRYQNFHKRIDLLFAVTAWPLFYLYFSTLVDNKNPFQKKKLLHFIFPSFLFILFCLQPVFTNEVFIIGRKFGFSIIVAFNVAYTLASYKLLATKVWNRNSEILVINQQNTIIKRWTKWFFILFTLLLFRFFINLALNNKDYWYINQNNFLWVGALIWMAMYAKILYSPEFLYGYEVFQNKIKEYKKNQIIFNNIWLLENPKGVTNVQDLVLKEKIAPHTENYVLSIEYLAVNTNTFLSENFKIVDLARKLDIPKSHLSFIFKYHAAISFNDFRKIIRIQKTILLIEEGYLKKDTMESLASVAGFTSYSAFFKSFKSITGMSPQEYIKNRSSYIA